ncbi:MAG: hypothetical protein ACRELB_20120 [Polyangiaceae bacterium]
MGTSKRTQGKSTDAALATQLIAGTKLHLATAASVAFASGTFTPTEIETSLQKLVTLRSDVDAARVALEAKLAAEADQVAALRAFMRAFVQFLLAAFSKSPDILAAFGLAPEKARTPPTAEQQAAAVAKRNATRAALGTRGAKQKAGIHGAVTGVVITPVAASQPAAPVESSGTSAQAVTGPGATTAPTPRS